GPKYSEASPDADPANTSSHSGASPHQYLTPHPVHFVPGVSFRLALRIMIADDLTSKANQAFEFAEVQLRKLITNHPSYFPLFTKAGKWKHQSESWTNWCEGFLGGMLWILARRTGDPWWRAKAEEYSRLIKHRQFDGAVHDLGFLFLPTWKVCYEGTAGNKIQSM